MAKVNRSIPLPECRGLKEELRATIENALRLKNLAILPPSNDGTKKPFPMEWKEYQNRIPSREQISKWYKSGLTGFGLVCGAVSDNLECLDFDESKIFDRFCKRMKKLGLSKLLKRLKEGYYERTPNGVHFLYRCSEISSSTKLATKPGKRNKSGNLKVITLIEIKGEGGLIICAPTYGNVNPDGEYELIGGGLSTIPLLTPRERKDLHDVARTFHIPTEESQRDELQSIRTETQNKAGRPGDDFNARAKWEDILAGWKVVYTVRNVKYLRRPGKSRVVSATINYMGNDLFRNFSTSTAFQLKSYDKFGAYAALNHHGNLSAAAKQLILDGYGGSGNGNNEQDEAAKTLAVNCFPEREFPLTVLPKYFRELVEAYSEALQCSPAFVAMNFLTILSGAAGNAVTLKLKNSWKTPPFIWLGVIGVTGSGKTHPIEAAMGPLFVLQDRETTRFKMEGINEK